MNINFEKLPAVIFDWLEEFSFAQLSDTQKKEVLTYFSEEEFDQMHQASIELRSVLNTRDETVPSQRKETLLSHFDEHHALKNKNHFFPGAVIAWQAAAIVLFLLSGWLFYQVFGLQKTGSVEQIAVTDTVYVDREVASMPEIVHDTVYRYKETKESSQQETSASESVMEAEMLESLGEMEGQPILELENLNTSPKGNSMKDDSLLRKFTFVSM